MKKPLSIEAFILAGGKSSRMGSDKGLLRLHGKAMITYVLETLEEVGVPVKIVTNNPRYKTFNYPLIPDLIPGKGPLGGLHTALHNTAADVVLLMSCDMPLITVEAVKELLIHAGEKEIVAVSADGRVNPLFALYPNSIKDMVEVKLKSDQLKMQELILESPHRLLKSIAEKWPLSLRNVNNPQQLKELEDTWKN